MKKESDSADTLIEEAQAQLEAEGAGPSAARRGPLGNPESQPVPAPGNIYITPLRFTLG